MKRQGKHGANLACRFANRPSDVWILLVTRKTRLFLFLFDTSTQKDSFRNFGCVLVNLAPSEQIPSVSVSAATPSSQSTWIWAVRRVIRSAPYLSLIKGPLKSDTPITINANGKKYSTLEVVGRGSFGVVYKARCESDGSIVAIKKVMQDPRFKVLALMNILSTSYLRWSSPRTASCRFFKPCTMKILWHSVIVFIATNGYVHSIPVYPGANFGTHLGQSLPTPGDGTHSWNHPCSHQSIYKEQRKNAHDLCEGKHVILPTKEGTVVSQRPLIGLLVVHLSIGSSFIQYSYNGYLSSRHQTSKSSCGYQARRTQTLWFWKREELASWRSECGLYLF